MSPGGGAERLPELFVSNPEPAYTCNARQRRERPAAPVLFPGIRAYRLRVSASPAGAGRTVAAQATILAEGRRGAEGGRHTA
jgi:hypothetical protein